MDDQNLDKQYKQEKEKQNEESFKHKDKEVKKKKCDTALIFLFPAKNKQTEWFTSLVL